MTVAPARGCGYDAGMIQYTFTQNGAVLATFLFPVTQEGDGVEGWLEAVEAFRNVIPGWAPGQHGVVVTIGAA